MYNWSEILGIIIRPDIIKTIFRKNFAINEKGISTEDQPVMRKESL